MSKLIPERPIYKREKIVAGYFALGVVALLFAAHLVLQKTALPLSPFLIKLFLELVIFGVPLLFFCHLRGDRAPAALRLRRPKASEIPLALAAAVALFSGCLLLSMLFGGIGALDKSATGATQSDLNTPAAVIFGAILFGLLPALVEELFFRGILTSEYERRGSVRAVLMSALLFSLSHFDFRNLLLYLFAGVLFSLVVYATDTLFWSILLHILYNLLFLFFGRYLASLYDFTGSMELFLFLLILAFLISFLLFCRSAAKSYREKAARSADDPRRAVPYAVQFYTTLDALFNWPIPACILISVAGFILF